MCQQDLYAQVVCAGCIFSVKSCIKIHYVGAEVKRKIMKLEQNSFSLYFLTVQNCSFNSDYFYASALKFIYLKHNIDCFITIHCFLISSENKGCFTNFSQTMLFQSRSTIFSIIAEYSFSPGSS